VLMPLREAAPQVLGSAGCWVAHASRVSGDGVRAIANSSSSEIVSAISVFRKACFGVTPKPTRETRVLPWLKNSVTAR